MEQKELLDSLAWIAFHKAYMPFNLRGWVSSLGLHVQERNASGVSRLQAGGKFRSYLDAWQEKDSEYVVKKFDQETWQHRFADVVEPTKEIASYLSMWAARGTVSEEILGPLDTAIRIYKKRGIWVGLFPQSGDSSKPQEEVAHSEILEEMCQLSGMPGKQMRAASRLSEGEVEILTKKFLVGKSIFPVTANATGEWYQKLAR